MYRDVYIVVILGTGGGSVTEGSRGVVFKRMKLRDLGEN